MKEKLTDEIRNIFCQLKAWISSEAEYVKLTAAEKMTVLLGTIALAAMAFVLIMIALVILSFCLVGVFASLVGQTLAYLCVSGIFLLLLAVIILLRKPLVFNPLARMLSKLIMK